MDLIINANVKDQVNKLKSLKKIGNILRIGSIGSCFGFALFIYLKVVKV